MPSVGDHSVVVLTVNSLVGRLSSVTVAVVTGTEGPAATHLPLGADAGLTRYEVSYVNATDIQTVAQSRLRRRRGLLHPAELARLEDAIRIGLGL
jgi:mRNA interferase MazF